MNLTGQAAEMHMPKVQTAEMHMPEVQAAELQMTLIIDNRLEKEE